MIEIIFDKPLKNLHTFGIEVKAKEFIDIKDESDLREIFTTKDIRNKPLLILGEGSNLLFLNDYEGLVLKMNIRGITIISKDSENVIVEASAGELWDDLVSFCVENEFYGIENLSLIPGTVGAAPIQNIGAYGAEIKDVFNSLEGFDLESFEKRILNLAECRFGYRDSIFKNELKEKFIITKVRLKLSVKKKFNLYYRALKEEFGRKNEEYISLKQVREAVKKIRNSKLPDHTNLGNAGSFFKNPEITEEQFLVLKSNFPSLVSFKMENGNFKLAAGWLIEDCGFRGKRIGNVGCYHHQSLVIVNYGNATGKEVLEFSEKIRNAVKKKFGVNINPEVNIIQ